MVPWAVEETELEKVKKVLDDFPEVKFTRNGKETALSPYMLARALKGIFPSLVLPEPPPEAETEDFLHALEYVKKMVKRKAEVLKLIPAAE
jgi:hypothetical protein